MTILDAVAKKQEVESASLSYTSLSDAVSRLASSCEYSAQKILDIKRQLDLGYYSRIITLDQYNQLCEELESIKPSQVFRKGQCHDLFHSIVKLVEDSESPCFVVRYEPAKDILHICDGSVTYILGKEVAKNGVVL